MSVTVDFESIGAGRGKANSFQVSGDIRDVAETIKDLIPGIDGEALHEELVNLAEEVRCLEENAPQYWHIYQEDKAFNVLKNRTVQGPGKVTIMDAEE